jgi:hypothetical protein
LEQRAAHRLIVSRDHVELDALGADGGALADLGATPETLPVVLVDHGQRAGVAFGLALGQQAQGGDFGGQEQRRRAVGACRDAGSAADAGRGVEGGRRPASSAPGMAWASGAAPVGG